MRIYRTDQFALPPEGHRFPAEKYQLLAHAVAAFGTADGKARQPAHGNCNKHMRQTMSPQVLDGSLPARAWREIGLPWSPQLVERSRRSVGATIAAARTALLHGCG
jgi:acetoin utilization deacetylase AcuC-like enzyme